MKLGRLNQVPKSWSGIPLGVAKESEGDEGAPRLFVSFVLEALASAHLSGYSQVGQRNAESATNLLNRARLSAKLLSVEDEVELSGDEFCIVETCISGYFTEMASVPLIGFLHESIV